MITWLFLLLALAALAAAYVTTSPGLLALWLLVSLALAVAWVMGLLARRVGHASRDMSQMVDLAEVERLRAQAEARRAAESTQGPVSPP